MHEASGSSSSSDPSLTQTILEKYPGGVTLLCTHVYAVALIAARRASCLQTAAHTREVVPVHLCAKRRVQATP